MNAYPRLDSKTGEITARGSVQHAIPSRKTEITLYDVIHLPEASGGKNSVVQQVNFIASTRPPQSYYFSGTWPWINGLRFLTAI
jgi:hypothetical protein